MIAKWEAHDLIEFFCAIKIIIMKTKFFYVESINLYVNVSLIQSFQLVKKQIVDYDSGRFIDVLQCCISMGKNAYFCDEKYYYELYKIVS